MAGRNLERRRKYWQRYYRKNRQRILAKKKEWNDHNWMERKLYQQYGISILEARKMILDGVAGFEPAID